MIERRIQTRLVELIGGYPAVALLGPRQVGKTTLALNVGATRPSLYLDLESPGDQAKLTDPELYLAEHEDKLVILDEVHRRPDVFQPLRGLIDKGRRSGKGTGRFLLLGSASMDLLKQSGETLAGRISFAELAPFDVLELGGESIDRLWIRGGFPGSVLAVDDATSLTWRRDFIRTYLERDIPQFGVRIPAETLRRFWTMLAHNQGGVLNAAQLARGIGVSGSTVAHYLDLLVDLLLVRRLQPWHRNVGKRLVKSPKVYIRDSGLVHALLGLATKEELLSHPIVGGSWEELRYRNVARRGPGGDGSQLLQDRGRSRNGPGAGVTGWSRLDDRGQAGSGPQAGTWVSHGHRRPGARKEFCSLQWARCFPLNDHTQAIGLVELARELEEMS